MRANYALVLVAVGGWLGINSVLSASAAELAPPPLLPPVPHYSWTGFYLGVNGGGARGSESFSGTQTTLLGPASFSGSPNSSGGLAGGQIGFNYQCPEHAVVGLELDADWAHITGSSSGCATFTGGFFNGFPFGCATNNFTLNGFETVRARVGYAWNDVILLYGTGGWAWSNLAVKSTTTCFFLACPGATFPFTGGTSSASNTFSGWTAGAGVEWGFSQNWSARLEYLHLEFENAQTQYANTITTPIGSVSTTNSITSTRGINVVRVGVNYLFNLGSW
jgi:outer membrane immunogenic protein